MTSKAAFLRTLRDALPDEPAPPTSTPAPVQYRSGRSGIDGFTEAWSALGGTIDRVATTTDVATAVATYAGDRSVAVVDHPDLAAIERQQTWPDCGIATLAQIEVGVVRARAAVAETGSVAISASDNLGRSASLLPEHAIFVFHVNEVVDNAGDVLRSPQRRGNDDGPPSQLVLVTGPSRSADIELFLVVGVHGPAAVHAIVIG